MFVREREDNVPPDHVGSARQTQEAGQSQQPEAVNVVALTELRANLGPQGDAVLTQLIQLFLDEVPATVAGIKAAAVGKNPDELAEAAHRLRGGAAIFGARPLANLCADAEDVCWTQDLTEAHQLVDRIADEIARVEEALRSMGAR